MHNVPPKNKKSEKQVSNEENSSAASIAFMVFGFGLVFYSFFLFHSQKNQASFSSVRPLHITSQIDPETSFDRKRKIEGLEISNQRVSAEIYKEQEMLKLSNKTLNHADIQDNLMRGVGLSGEQNSQTQLHERLKNERDSYPDVLISRELAIDHAIYDQAVSDEQKDRRVFVERLKKRAAAQNLEVQYNSKTGEILIEQGPDANGNH